MEDDNLAKKLEEISLPKIELPNHRTKLRLLLLEKYFPDKRRGEIFSVLNKLIPATAFVIILLFIFLGKVSFPTDNVARAKEIALQNTEIKNWVETGAKIKDVQIIDGMAYLLIEPTETIVAEETSQVPPAVGFKAEGVPKEKKEMITDRESFQGALAEVNIKEKRISKIDSLSTTINKLIKTKEEKTKEIAEKSPEIQNNIPEGAEVLNISVQTPRFRLEKQGDSFFPIPESEKEEKASIIYKSDGNRWEGRIDLNKEEVEEINFLGNIENDATLENSER